MNGAYIMKELIYIKRLVIFLIAVVIFGSCSETNVDPLVSEITGRLDSLKQVYAPDTRIAIWNVAIHNQKDNKIQVDAEVQDSQALKALLKLKSEYPKVNFIVKILPDPTEKKIYALIDNSVTGIRRRTTRASEMLSQALLGTPVKVFKKKGEWYYIQTPNQYFGWINQKDIVRFDAAGLKKYETGKKIVFNRQYGFSYTRPNTKSQVVSDLVVGCILPVKSEVSGFYQVEYPDGRQAFVKKDQVIDLKTLFQKKPVGKELVKTALKFNGIPYLWGGFSSKGIDCSGFSSAIYYLNGIVLQRDASQQTKTGKEITTDYDFTKLQPGDLLFFGRKAKGSVPEKVTHVAMYIGNGRFIHSSGRVHISCMDPANPDFEKKYESLFVRAVRIIGYDNGKTIQRIADNPFYKMLNTK